MSRFVLTQLSNWKSFFTKILPKKLSQYHYRAFFVFLVIAFFVGTTKVVSAQSFESSLLGFFSSIVLAVSQLAIGLSIFFLRFFVTLASYNNYIDVSVVKLGWVMVRDVANMFFVVALLVIAFATILGIEKYEWKKSLVKIVLMAILINFSNLIAQIIIDAAHVFTITFLNAVSASAGGNLINMFNLEKINSLVQGADLGTDITGAGIEVIAASLISLAFAIATAVSLGSYAIVMTVRVVVLWALIILSPLAYLFSAMPKGEKYASRWWEEFTKHVIVAPVMVFFLWLAFATLGTGQIMSEIQTGNSIRLQQGTDPISISISEVSTWENMANYIIGFIFLYIGLKMTQETGATGSHLVGSAINYGKQAFTIGSGYAFGRWMTGKGKDNGKLLGGKALKGVGKYAYNKTGLSSFIGERKATFANMKKERIMNAVTKTKGLEDSAREEREKGNKGKAFLLSLRSKWHQPVQRAAKQAEDWNKAAEAFKETWEESQSTSDTEAGQVKQRAYTERDKVKAKAAEKVRQKQQEQEALANAMQDEMTLRLDTENNELNSGLQESLKNIETEYNPILEAGNDDKKVLNWLMNERDHKVAKIEEDSSLTDDQKTEQIGKINDEYSENKNALRGGTEENAMVKGKYNHAMMELLDKEKSELVANYNVSTQDYDAIANNRTANLNASLASGEIKQPEYDKKIREIEKSREVSKQAQKAVMDDEKIQKETARVAALPDGSEEKAKALAELNKKKLETFQDKFAESYQDFVLQNRSDEFFERAGLSMSGGDKKGAQKKISVLRRDNSAGQLWQFSQFVTNEQKTQAKSGAVAEELGKKSRQKQEIKTSDARDSLRIAQNKTAVFRQQTEDKHFKENKEEMDALNYREITKQGGLIAKKIQDAIKNVKVVDPALREALASSIASAAGRGSEEATAAISEILKAVGFEENISSNDLLGQQRKMLSMLLGKNVEKVAGENENITVQRAYKDFVDSHGGDDKAQVVLKYVDSALKNAGSDGLLHSVGLFDDKNVDENGRVKIKMQTDRQSFGETRQYFAERQKPNTLTGIDGILNTTNNNQFTINVIDNKGNRTSQIDQLAKNALKKTLDGIKQNTQLTSAFKTQLQQWHEQDGRNFEAMLEELSEESKNAIEKVIHK